MIFTCIVCDDFDGTKEQVKEHKEKEHPGFVKFQKLHSKYR